MRQLLLMVLFAVGSINVNAQDAIGVEPQDVEIGDVLRIGQPDATRYKHIDFPRPNFIIKRGGIANYNGVEGKKVVVSSIKIKKDGVVQVKVKRADGGRFFGSHKFVSADLKDALKSGELRKI